MKEAEVIEPAKAVTPATLKALSREGDGLAIRMNAAEIDAQITTARAYPRMVTAAIEAITSMAIMTPEVSATMIYTLPRDGKDIEGPSIRLAEIAAQCWGNCRVAARVTVVDRAEGFVEAEGIYHDLQTNMATKATVRRRITNKYGNLYSDDMIITTGNAACSIARRNAILAGVPKAAYLPAYEGAAKVLSGDMVDLKKNFDAALEAFKLDFNVPPEKVFAALKISGEAEAGLAHIRKMRGMYSALKNEEATVDEMFNPRSADAERPGGVKDPLKDKPAEGADSKPGVPKTAAQYIAHADAWLGAATNEPAARAQWKEERQLRDKCGVTKAEREPLEQKLEQKFAKTG